MSDVSQPAPVDQGFPNPHADHFEGERTPEEQYEYEWQQDRRDSAAAAETVAPASKSKGAKAPGD